MRDQTSPNFAPRNLFADRAAVRRARAATPPSLGTPVDPLGNFGLAAEHAGGEGVTATEPSTKRDLQDHARNRLAEVVSPDVTEIHRPREMDMLVAPLVEKPVARPSDDVDLS